MRSRRLPAPVSAEVEHQTGVRQALALITLHLAEHTGPDNAVLTGGAYRAAWLDIQGARTEARVVGFLVALARYLALDVGKGTGEAPEDVIVRVVTTAEESTSGPG